MYETNAVEPCAFNKTKRGVQYIVVIYFDGLMITCKEQPMINALLLALTAAFRDSPTITTGAVHSYLGMQFDYSHCEIVSVSMEGYITDLLKSTNIQGTADTPAAAYLFEVRYSIPLLGPALKETFHSVVMRILYLAKRVRSDVLLATSFLVTRVLTPDEDDQKKHQRLLRYLNGTSKLGMRLAYAPEAIVQLFADASYSVHSDYRSHTGMVMTLGAGPIDLRSTKQKLNTKSSTEAELIALSDMAGQALWM
jgi:hypothetical protein